MSEFVWSKDPEPHSLRRSQIIESHRDITRLAGHEWRSKYLCVFGLVLPQIWLSVRTAHLPWPAYLFIAYAIGGTITQAHFLAIHELSHNLFFKKSSHNRLFSCIANLPIGIPFAIAFRSYHLEHHKSQGVDGVDTDIPSLLEARVVRGPFRKMLWLGCQILVYAIRPMCIKSVPVSRWLLFNWCTQLLFNAGLVCLFGMQPIYYFLLCVFLAGGLHPCAGHFISEHYVFPHLSDTQETYSYYGPLNWLTWNVGYHNEHHDFPNIAWSTLPRVKETAPEYYDSLQTCDSWVGVLLDYIVRSEIGPQSRVKRPKTKAS